MSIRENSHRHQHFNRAEHTHTHTNACTSTEKHANNVQNIIFLHLFRSFFSFHSPFHCWTEPLLFLVLTDIHWKKQLHKRLTDKWFVKMPWNSFTSVSWFWTFVSFKIQTDNEIHILPKHSIHFPYIQIIPYIVMHNRQGIIIWMCQCLNAHSIWFSWSSFFFLLPID